MPVTEQKRCSLYILPVACVSTGVLNQISSKCSLMQVQAPSFVWCLCRQFHPCYPNLMQAPASMCWPEQSSECGKHTWLSFDLQSMNGRPADHIVNVPAGASIGVLAKIESADSVMHLEEILDAVDGAMVARGDLGAELPVEQVRLLFASILPGSPAELQWHDSAAGLLNTQALPVPFTCLCCMPAVRHWTPVMLPWHRLWGSRSVLVQAS